MTLFNAAEETAQYHCTCTIHFTISTCTRIPISQSTSAITIIQTTYESCMSTYCLHNDKDLIILTTYNSMALDLLYRLGYGELTKPWVIQVVKIISQMKVLQSNRLIDPWNSRSDLTQGNINTMFKKYSTFFKINVRQYTMHYLCQANCNL